MREMARDNYSVAKMMETPKLLEQAMVKAREKKVPYKMNVRSWRNFVYLLGAFANRSLILTFTRCWILGSNQYLYCGFYNTKGTGNLRAASCELGLGLGLQLAARN